VRIFSRWNDIISLSGRGAALDFVLDKPQGLSQICHIYRRKIFRFMIP